MEKLASGIYRFRFGTPEDLTPFRVLSPVAADRRLGELPDTQLPFGEESIGFRLRKGGCLLEIPLSADEDIYGMGLQLKSFRQSGLKKYLRPNSDPTADTGDSHAPVPFYISTAGYGILVDTARYAHFYLGNCKMRGSRQDREGFVSAGTEVGHWWVKKGSGNVFVDIPAASGVDVYVFCGTDIRDALARYNLFSGGGALPPIWGLGVMYRAYMYADQRRIEELARTLRDTGMPCDMFGFEPGWQTHYYSCSYKWDEEKFPDHAEILRSLCDKGFKVNVWEHAYVHPESPIFEDMKDCSADEYVWDGLVPDFSVTKAQKVFGDHHRALAEEGLTGFKLDECDNSDYTANWGFADFAEFPSGMDGEQMHCLMGELYQKTMTEIFTKQGRRTWGESRSSGAFAAPLPYVLYSDLYDHEDFVRGMASAACSGLLWTPEVRQADSNEELLRRIAAAVVSPQMVLNCYQVKTPPWTQWDMWKNLEGELLPDADELTDAVRELLKMRMRLIPHLYAAYYRYHECGIPPVRPLVLDYPDDLHLRACYDEFMVGDGLLAAPVIYGRGDRRSVILPGGRWYDVMTGEAFDGGREIVRETKPGDIPLFAREGTLLALAEPVQFVTPETVFDLELTAYGAGTVSCTLIDDDGESLDGTGQTLRTTFCAEGDILRATDQGSRYRVISFKRIV